MIRGIIDQQDMTTILDALRNAEYNFATVGKLSQHPIWMVAMTQLGNAIRALENGHSPNDVLQEHMFGDVNTEPPQPLTP